MQEHLDSHFRQNRRAKETIGRGHSRSWFISIQVIPILCLLSSKVILIYWQDFLSERSDPKGKGREIDVEGNNESSRLKKEAELRASTVVVPEGEEAKSIACPVCKESLKSEFLDDEEEWVWRNAVQVKNKVSYVHCVSRFELRVEHFHLDLPRDLPRRNGNIRFPRL